MSILIWIITGIIAGWLAGMVVKGKGFGIVGDFVVGIVGAVIGGWLGGMIGIAPTNIIGQILVAAFGGVILVLLVRLLVK